MSIFISIASYQDPLLVSTIFSAYNNAKDKDDLVFSICDQSDNGIAINEVAFSNQIHYEHVDPLFSKGPCWARHRAQSFFNDEEKTGFGIFARIINGGGKVIAIPAPKAAETKSRKFFDNMDKWAKKEMQMPGLGYARLRKNDEGVVDSQDPVLKNFEKEHLKTLLKKIDLNDGDGVFFAAGKKNEAYKLAGAARNKVAYELEIIPDGIFKFAWIVDYPMYEWDEDHKKIDFSHNPFSMPQGGLSVLNEAKTNDDILNILAYQYDIVCNGVELSSGAIRNHKAEVMYKAFEIAGYGPEVVEEKFSGMINAFKFGAPPHGGIAPGVDRIVMLLAGTNTIRDVILFPMNGQAQDLMMNAPAEVDLKQLKELSLKLIPTSD